MPTKYFIDAHVHLMTPYRIKGGIKWIRRVVKEYEQLDLDITVDELLKQMKSAGANFFLIIFILFSRGKPRH